MTISASEAINPLKHTDRFFIGGQWVTPSSDAQINVIDSDTEQLYFSVPEAQAADIDRAVTAAKEAFDNGPWRWLTHHQRAEYLRAIGAELKRRSEDIGQIWPREAGVLYSSARNGGAGAERTWNGVSNGLIYGHPAQLGWQVIAVLVGPAYAFAGTYVILRVIGLFMALRVTPREEALGMDVVQHGEEAYTTGEGAILVVSDGDEIPVASAR